jgi:predicted amidohydrolase YtcJ
MGMMDGMREARCLETHTIAGCLALLAALSSPARAETGADLILRNGKVVTADPEFSVRQAIAVAGERILRVGSDEEVLRAAGPRTRIVDLAGKTVLPGLMDSHVHATSACMTEFDHPIPPMRGIEDVLAHVRDRADALEDGEWIVLEQVFITRLAERRYPTREELDRAAPRNPVLFSTGPDASLSSLALERSGIGKGFEIQDGGPGRVEKDPRTGEPTGILRSATRLVKVKRPEKEPGEDDRLRRLAELIRDYNSSGITAIADRNAGDEAAELYSALRRRGELTARVFLSRAVDAQKPLDEVLARIREIAREPLRTSGDATLRTGGIKVFLDGGMLTGSAYLREPWGKSAIYSIDDPEYRGVLFIPPDRLLAMVRAAAEAGLQFTAHSVGDGAVHALLDAYEEAAKTLPIAATRPCITHSNFMSREAVEKLAKLGVVLDVQPIWLHLDGATLAAQFGRDRLRWFQPLRSIAAAKGIAGGGSDHMQKVGSLRSVNPYNPFLGMWIAISRRALGLSEPLVPEEALSREQAVRLYTTNNAWILGLEKEAGSLEAGKLADLIVIDRDVLSCPVDEIRETAVLETYVGGRLVPRPVK